VSKKAVLKKILRSFFGFFNLEVRQKRRNVISSPHNKQMRGGLERFRRLDETISTVIDIGAAAGSWSLSALEIWPSCFYLLMEPLEERRAELLELTRLHPNFSFVPRAAGRESGAVTFSIADDLDGSGVASSTQRGETRSVDVTSIEVEVKRLNLPGPYLIKLDTHGYEVPILEGCEGIIKHVSLFVIECYGFQIADNSLLFWDMCKYMDKLGFRLFDIVDIMHRPDDGAFWQCDAFFIRKEHPLFMSNQYK
jgi:FkbM family methyltransferase